MHTDRYIHSQLTHTPLLSLPQSRALLLHRRAMLSHSCEVDGRAFPMKNHLLCKREFHTEQSTGPENQDDLENGYGKKGKRTTGQIPPPHPRLWHLAAWCSATHLSFQVPQRPTVPPATFCISRCHCPTAHPGTPDQTGRLHTSSC